MPAAIIAVLSVLLAAPAAADDGPAAHPWAMRLGFTLPYGTQPGARLGGLYDIALDPPGGTGWRSTLTVGPQLALYTQPARNTHVQAGALAGYGLHGPGGWVTHHISAGLAYVAEAYIARVTVDLGSGETSDDHALRNHALPSLHYTFGLNLHRRWAWYLDVGAGLLLSPDVDSALYLAADTGVQFRFGAVDAPDGGQHAAP